MKHGAELRRPQHLFRGPAGQNLLLEKNDLIGIEPQGGEIVGGEEDGEVIGAANFVQQLHDQVFPAHIHAGKGLIQNQDLRNRLQGQGQEDPLQLSAGEGSNAFF